MKLHVKPKIPCRQEQFRKVNEKVIESIGKTKIDTSHNKISIVFLETYLTVTEIP